MPHDANQPKGWRGEGNQPKRTPKYGWKPKSAGIEKSLLMRRLTQVSLALSVFMCIAIIVFMYYLLSRPQLTSIIVVSAQPSTDAANLRAPLDFHGWEGCKKLIHYVKETKDTTKDFENAEILPKNNAPFVLSNDKLSELVALVNDNKTSTKVIIYFGLLGFAGENGPCLFGSHGEIIQVRKIIEELAKVAGEKKEIVLLFDAARLPVAPELGILRNDFVRSCEDHLAKDLKGIQHLTVICSSSKDERAWNSDEWRCSAFLQQVLEALRGSAKAKSNSNEIQLNHFFETVKEQTVRWTKLRFDSVQTPTLIGIEKAPTPVIIVQRNTTTGGKHTPLDDKDTDHNTPGYNWVDKVHNQLELLEKHSRIAVDLAKARPHPAVYTPVSWRRFRELLVRLEQALRMSDNETATLLDGELTTLSNNIKGAQELKFRNVSETNTIWPVILANSTEQVRETAKLAKDKLSKSVTLTDPIPKQAETHLAYKLAEFWKDRDSSPPPELRKLALETRQLAERAALGCPENAPEYFYTERLWELLNSDLKKLDAQRRLAEDYLFSDGKENHDAAEKQLKEVKQEYERLIGKWQPLQKAWSTYHRAVSEASFLTKWHVYYGAEELQNQDSRERMKKLWKRIHDLEQELISVKQNNASKMMEGLDKTCREIDDFMSSEMTQFMEKVNAAVENTARTQVPRHQLELLLSCPWPIPSNSEAEKYLVDARVNAIIKTRQASRNLHGREKDSETPPRKNDLDKIVQYRGELINSMLDTINPRIKLFPFDGSPKSSIDLGKEIELFWRMLTTEEPGESKGEQADLNARYMLAFSAGAPKEVVLKLRDDQYRTLLRDHAKRICLDHWYDKNQQKPYFQTTAQRYLECEGFPVEPDEDLNKWLNSKPLSWKQTALNQKWTSELQRPWEIAVESLLGKQIDGRIALWADRKGNATAIDLKEGDKQRVSMPLQNARRTLTLEAKDVAGAESKEIKLVFTPRCYFRGQELEKDEPITVTRQPSLIVTEHAMKEEGGTFTLTKAKDLRLGLGHLAIVLDYSHSMRVSLDPNPKRNKDGEAIDWDWKREDSRIRQAISGLNKLLISLSENVDEIDISIRIFSEENDKTKSLQKSILKGDDDPLRDQSVKELTEQIDSTLMFVGTLKKQGDKRVLIHQENKEPQLTLDEFVDKLRDKVPYSSTPLLKSMVAAKKSLPPNIENATLLVLTDGADTSLGEVKKENDPRIEMLRQSFEKEFMNSGLSIKIILFSNDESEKKIAKSQFKRFKNDTSECVVTEAIDSQSLLEELKRSFRVKMQVFKNGKVVPSNEKDSQYFIAHEDKTPLGKLSYSPLLNGDHTSRVWINDKQQLSFEPGDHMFIRLKDANNKVKYTRELFKDVLKLSQGNIEQRFIQGEYDGKKTPWHLTVAENRDPGYLKLTLEHESHQLEPVGTPPVLSMYRPKFVWWNVKAVGEGGKEQQAQGTVQISNLNHYYAPAWEVFQGPTQDKMLNIQAWVSENTIQKESLPSFARSELKNENVLPLNNQTSISFEKHYLMDGTQRTPEKVPCLVVRYRFNENGPQRVWFEKPTGVKRSDHYFYPEAQTLTVYFSPFNPTDSPEEKLTLKYINLDDVTRQLTRPVVSANIPMNMNWPPGPDLNTK